MSDTELRPRAHSEALPKLPSGRWRIVGAWSSMRRTRQQDDPLPTPSGITPGRRDSTLDTPRKRVSLFLKRRCGEGGLRRAQSGLVPPVVADGGGEGGRYMAYAAEMDEIEVVDRRAGIRVDEEIVGEICLEDFAEDDEEWSVDFEGISRRPSVKLEGVRFTGEEVKKLLEMGLEDWFEVDSEKEWAEFQVAEELLEEWRLAGEEHNRLCRGWRAGTADIRLFVDDWERVHGVRHDGVG